MKLPRWLVIGMWTTSVLSVLAAAGWWWVTWPERTAEQFVVLLESGEIDAANAMMFTGSKVSYSTESDLIHIDAPRFGQTASKAYVVREFRERTTRVRSPWDVATARKAFDAGDLILRVEMNRVSLAFGC